ALACSFALTERASKLVHQRSSANNGRTICRGCCCCHSSRYRRQCTLGAQIRSSPSASAARPRDRQTTRPKDTDTLGVRFASLQRAIPSADKVGVVLVL